MRNFLIISFIAVAAIIHFTGARLRDKPLPLKAEEPEFEEIAGAVEPGETLIGIFKKHGLDPAGLVSIKSASSRIYNLRRIRPGRPYSIVHDGKGSVLALKYFIDDDYFLSARRTDGGVFSAEKIPVPYERRGAFVGGLLRDNLVSSLDNLELALGISDIFAWDIDFSTDLRDGDEFRVMVEELYLDGEFRKYGNILSARFINNGRTYRAYRFEEAGGGAGYYDEEGQSVRRAFLKAPLSYRRVSSRFSGRRFHPILKIVRPHYGVDYSAPSGTPVSSVGDGTVVSAGRRGENGRQVVVRHPNGYTTYYGHLSRIPRGVRQGAQVKQGDVVGYVGSSGLSTGPHLDYRIKKNGRFINPLALKLPSAKALSGARLEEFKALMAAMDAKMNAAEGAPAKNSAKASLLVD